MSLTELKINQFRNLKAIDINPSTHFNVFYGNNGAGKTSLLEAIYFLGLGRSFRTHQADLIIQNNTDCFTIYASLNETTMQIPLGIERNINGEKRIRLNGENVNSLALLAKKLPLQLLSTEVHRYFTDGPKLRRQFLDWGVFHVEHLFLGTWQKFQQVLKQRNAALKNRAPLKEINAWNIEFVALANQLDEFRQHYVAELQLILTELLSSLFQMDQLTLTYSRGWSTELNLEQVLHKNIHRDLQVGYTQYGPQRSDLQLFYVDADSKVAVQNFLSQGQQKLAGYALHLAQGMLMAQSTGRKPIYLIDDLPSELDAEKRSKIIQKLQEIESQVFITGITLDDLTELLAFPHTKMFHVEHGTLKLI